MSEEGQGGLQDAPFSYHESGGNKVFISWRGNQAMVLRGRKAESFLQRVTGLDAAGQQMAMAKETGNFKRGNER